MRVHLTRALEPDLEPLFSAAFQAGVSLSSGEGTPPDTEVLVDGFPSLDQLEALPRLRSVVVPFAGLVPRSRDVLLQRPDLTVYTTHHNAAATAEKAVELLFAVSKQTLANDRAMRKGDWSPRFEGVDALELNGRSATVLGFGEIGSRVARALQALGMTVTGVRRKGPFGEQDGATVVPTCQVDGLWAGTQALLVCTPLTPETEGMVSAKALDALPSDAIVVNVGRGPIVDEGALYEALASNRICGAGLDVWWNYPQAGDSCPPSAFPFASLPNVVMSPHVGGVVSDSEPKRCRALCDLLLRLVSRDPTLMATDVSAGY